MRNQKSSKPPIWTVLDALQWTAAYFKSHHIDSPRLTAELLLCAVLGLQRIDLYIRHDQPLSEEELANYRLLIQRRVRHEPLAYILEEKEFMGLRLGVGPNVLVPRPETEHLVEAAIARIPAESRSRHRILELGVGSGAIIVSVAVNRPGSQYIGVDRSYLALSIARQNARHHKVADRIAFLAGDWLEAFNCNDIGFDMILSNPPYIPSDQIRQLQPEIAEYEPVTALDGGADGLDDIRKIIAGAAYRLKSDGYLIMEIGFDQKADVIRISDQVGAYKDIGFIKDYGGHDRVAVLKRRKSLCEGKCYES